MTYARGDVVRSVDPFKLGDDAERYWLICNGDDRPVADEQFIASTRSLPVVPVDASTVDTVAVDGRAVDLARD